MRADKGFAPIYAGHEPVMLLLHQSALVLILLILTFIFLAPEGIEPSRVMMKTLCLNHLTIRPYVLIVIEVQCKYRTCFSWLQNSYITFMLTGLRLKYITFV